MDRRTLLRIAASAGASLAVSPLLGQTPEPAPFSEAELDRLALGLAAQPYVPPQKYADDQLSNIKYDDYKNIKYKFYEAIWRDANLPFRLEMYHTAGNFYAFPVEIFIVDDGKAKRFEYSRDLFDFSKLPVPTTTKAGFAGFRVLTQLADPTKFEEFVSFLGASNFRAMAQGQAFGVSARGLAINTGQATGEEFPLFTKFWIERPKQTDDKITIHALLDSASVVGRYKFIVTKGRDTTMETTAVLFPRKRIPYVGIAAMSSMFFSSPSSPPKKRDYRPRVHSSEALLIANGSGEWICRPLINPERLQFSVFVDKNPKGFGLVQRTRSFAEYQDLDASYQQQPSLWIEPIGDWGEGSVDLIELPAPDELHENVICFWKPKEGLAPGSADGTRFSYRMHWCWDPPAKSGLATVFQTRLGEMRGGDPRFYVDFAGAEADNLACAPSASPGEVSDVRWLKNPSIGGRRVAFNPPSPGSQPIDLRATVVQPDGKPASETWIFRWVR